MEIVHISDPHFGTIRPGTEDALVSEIQSALPDFIICTGDITQRAREDQFQAARRFFDFFPKDRTLICPGNHDIPLFSLWARLTNPFGRFVSELRPTTEYVVQGKELGIVVLNTCPRLRHVQGRADLLGLENYLNEIKSSPFKIVAFHQPLDCKRKEDEKNLLLNRAEVALLLNRHNVDLAISGHIHDPYVTTSEARYKSRPFVISVAGTCLSTRTRSGAPNSFWRYKLDTQEGRLHARRFDFDRQSSFRLVEDHRFLRNSDGWVRA